MSVSTLLTGSSATDRILTRYGTLNGTLVNATGTGTTVTFSCGFKYDFGNEEDFNTAKDAFTQLSPMGDGLIKVTNLSNERDPISFGDYSRMGMRPSLTGKFHPYGRTDLITVTLSVIGNSLDDYLLTSLASSLTGVSVNNMFKSAPVVNMTIIPGNAPGYEISCVCGTFDSYNPGFNMGTNAKVRDKTFSLRFKQVTAPSYSKEKYNPTAGGWDSFTANFTS